MRNQIPINLSISLVLSSIPCSLLSQFDAIPDSSAKWTIGSFEGPNQVASYDLYLQYDNDTLIDGQEFGKLRFHPSNTYYGAIRDNGNGQVFYHTTDNETHLLYDFDVIVGDTIFDVYVNGFAVSGLFDMIVSSVDTLFIAGSAHRQIGISTLIMGPPAVDFWVQGIGGSGGLVSTCGCGSVSGYNSLSCMSLNNTIMYGQLAGQQGSCFTVTDIVEEDNLHAIRPSSNPSAALFTFNLKQPKRIIVYDAFGSEVLKTFGTSVDLGGEPEGVYVARVFMGGLGNYAQVVRLVVAR